MTVWDAEGTGQIEFDRSEVGATELGYIVENRAIVHALLARVADAPDIAVMSPVALQSCARLASSRMSLELDGGQQLEADLLVAADGALSRVRQMMGFRSRAG